MGTNELMVQQKESSWLVRRCTEPGCGVMVREPLSAHEPDPVCKWHKANQAYASDNIHTQPAVGPLIDRDEFGQDLFAAIKAQAGLRQAQKTEAIYQRKGLKRQVLEAQMQQKALQHELDTILSRDTIAPEDLKRLLKIT